MVYCYVYLDERPRPGGDDEEIFIVVPDTSKIALAVPLHTLPEFLTVLERAVGDLPMPECPACTASMPCRVVCSSAYNEPRKAGSPVSGPVLCAAVNPETGAEHVTNPEVPEPTSGGLAGKIAGRLKAAAGSAVGNEDLAREGRLQQAQVEAEAEAEVAAERARQVEAEADLEAERKENELERERLENEIAAREREEAIERERREAELAAQAEARHQKEAAGRKEQLQERGADLAERAAEAERVAAAQEAARLEREARAAHANADAIDPEER